MQARTKCPMCKTYMHLSREDIKAVDLFALYPETDKSNSSQYCSNLQLPPYYVGQDLPSVHTLNENKSNWFGGLKDRVKAMKTCTCQGCQVHRKIMNRDYRIVNPQDLKRFIKT